MSLTLAIDVIYYVYYVVQLTYNGKIVFNRGSESEMTIFFAQIKGSFPVWTVNT